jgi:hypothetical protein
VPFHSRVRCPSPQLTWCLMRPCPAKQGSIHQISNSIAAKAAGTQLSVSCPKGAAALGAAVTRPPTSAPFCFLLCRSKHHGLGRTPRPAVPPSRDSGVSWVSMQADDERACRRVAACPGLACPVRRACCLLQPATARTREQECSACLIRGVNA